MADAGAPPTPLELKERIQAEKQGLSFLMYHDGAGHQQIYMLEDAAYRKIIIGRGLDADVPLGWDLKVSGIHAELERVGDTWAIVDDGLSRNGTFVNDDRING